MITDFWKHTGSRAPWGMFDPDDSLNFAFDASDFVAAAAVGSPGVTLASCVMAYLDPKLKVLQTQTYGTATVFRIERDTAIDAANGDWCKMTIRTTLSDGQHADATYWLVLADN